MPTSTLPTYSLQVREQRSGPVYTVMFRWPAGRQVKRTIGPAWTKRGRPPEVKVGSLHLGGLAPEDAEEFYASHYLVEAAPAEPPDHGLTSIVIVRRSAGRHSSTRSAHSTRQMPLPSKYSCAPRSKNSRGLLSR